MDASIDGRLDRWTPRSRPAAPSIDGRLDRWTPRYRPTTASSKDRRLDRWTPRQMDASIDGRLVAAPLPPQLMTPSQPLAPPR
jgi:hypothetical protein